MIFIFSYDTLTIYNGGSNASLMLGNPYCGNSLPPSQISSSNQLFIHFHSDGSDTGNGFKLEYNETSKNPSKHDVLELEKDKKIVKVHTCYVHLEIFQSHPLCMSHHIQVKEVLDSNTRTSTWQLFYKKKRRVIVP